MRRHWPTKFIASLGLLLAVAHATAFSAPPEKAPPTPSAAPTPIEPADPADTAELRAAIKSAKDDFAREATAYSKKQAEENKARTEAAKAAAERARQRSHREQRHEEEHGYWNKRGPETHAGDGKSSEEFDKRLAGQKPGARSANPDLVPSWAELMKSEIRAEKSVDPLAGTDERPLPAKGDPLDCKPVRAFVKEFRGRISDARLKVLLEKVRTGAAVKSVPASPA